MGDNEKLARRIEKKDGTFEDQKFIHHIKGVSEFSEERVSKFFLKNVGKILGLSINIFAKSSHLTQVR